MLKAFFPIHRLTQMTMNSELVQIQSDSVAEGWVQTLHQGWQFLEVKVEELHHCTRIEQGQASLAMGLYL